MPDVEYHGWTHKFGGSDPVPFDYVFIREVVVENDGDPITFDPILQDYRHLVVELLAVSDSAFAANALKIVLNGDTGNSYGHSGLYIWGDSFDYVAPYAAVEGDDSILIGDIIESTGFVAAGRMTSVKLELPYYSLADTEKHVRWHTVGDMVSGSDRVYSTFGGGNRSIGVDGDPITQIDLSPDSGQWVAGSRASLYAIR